MGTPLLALRTVLLYCYCIYLIFSSFYFRLCSLCRSRLPAFLHPRLFVLLCTSIAISTLFSPQFSTISPCLSSMSFRCPSHIAPSQFIHCSSAFHDFDSCYHLLMSSRRDCSDQYSLDHSARLDGVSRVPSVLWCSAHWATQTAK